MALSHCFGRRVINMKAWIENGKVRDICIGNPDDCYHPSIAKFYDTDVPDDTENGDGWVNGEIIKPVMPEPSESAPPLIPIISPVEFKLLFTPQERLAIKAEIVNDDVLEDLFTILDDPRLKEVNLNLESNKAVMDYLESKGLITAERKAEIMTGIMK